MSQRLKMTSWAIALSMLSGIAATGTSAAVSEQEAREIAVEAYIYFYPLVTMDLTRKQFTNVEPGKELQGADEHVRQHPGVPAGATSRASCGRISIRCIPSAGSISRKSRRSSRCRTRTAATICCRCSTCGRTSSLPPAGGQRAPRRHTFLLVPPAWRPDLRERSSRIQAPAGMQLIDAPTPYVWIIGRTKDRRPAGLRRRPQDSSRLQNGAAVAVGQDAEAARVKIDPTVDMKTPPKVQVDSMAGDKFFAYAAELLKLQPPHITDEPILARMKRIGIEPGKSFNFDSSTPAVKKALEAAPADGQKLMKWKMATLARVVNFWSHEYRHDGRVRQLLSQTGDRRPGRPRRQSARGRDLSAQPRRRGRQAAQRREQVHDSFRQGRRCRP